MSVQTQSATKREVLKSAWFWYYMLFWANIICFYMGTVKSCRVVANILGLCIENVDFFCKKFMFILKKWFSIFHSKYWALEAITISHKSGYLQISSRKNNGTFNSTKKVTHFSTFWKKVNRSPLKWYCIDRNKW